MSLYNDLQQAKSEEDVKTIYIKYLKLDKYVNNSKGQISLGLVDIKTDKIWFEAKHIQTNTIEMFTQLLHYVAKDYKEGKSIPPFLSVIDNTKAAIMETKRIEPLIADKSISWGKSASKFNDEITAKVGNYIHNNFVEYYLKDFENDFIKSVQNAFLKGEIIRTRINPNNLKIVFDRWVEQIGQYIPLENKDLLTKIDEDYKNKNLVQLFYADIMNDNNVSSEQYNLQASLVVKNNKKHFFFNGKMYEILNIKEYNNFWSIYNRPPAEEDRDELLSKRDSLIPLNDRQFKGAYFTPLLVVEKAYDYLTNILGKNWQKDYILWDPCCGVGNLQTKHSNLRNVFISTIEEHDISIIKNNNQLPGATAWQYDFLNDDITPDGKIDYTLSNKMPKELQELIKFGTINGEKKKLLILMNPPYAETGNRAVISGSQNKHKDNVATTKVANNLMASKFGKATNELFTQFLARLLIEVPNATIATFSKLKYVNAPNFEKFRQHFTPQFLGGFMVHSLAFEGLKGNFPIGFLAWNLAKKQPITQITLDVFSKTMVPLGQKQFYNLPNNKFLNVWIDRPKANKEIVVPLKNAVDVANNNKSFWTDENAKGYMVYDGNDMQQASQGTALFSSIAKLGHKGGMYITPQNLLQAGVVFAVRRIVKPTWQNDRDQFLQPNASLDKKFISNCLVYMLFSGSNLTATAVNLPYNNQNYNLTNHFLPFSEAQVKATGRFKSTFLIDFIEKENIKFTPQAQKVLDCALQVWQLYFKTKFSASILKEYKLLNEKGEMLPDVGWYQVRKSLESHEKEIFGNSKALKTYFTPSYTAFQEAYQTLAEEILPQVYEYEFLKK